MLRIDQQMGNYRLVRRVGQGHFADVYLGEHLYLKTFAAIKILHAAVSRDMLHKFLQEAQSVAHLHHPHIVQVLDFGIDSASHTPFLVMEYAPYGSLRQHYPEHCRMPLTLVARYVLQIASALQYAHDHHLIHRDVKPENILLKAHDEVLLSDFSLVAAAHDTSSLKTLDNGGTVHYMAPEQLHGKPRPASDQYSLAVMVYEWLCGERPFEGTTPIDIAIQHITLLPPPLLERVPSLSPAVAQVVHRGLEKEADRRFSSVTAFAEALADAIADIEVPVIEATTKPVMTTAPVQTATVQAAPVQAATDQVAQPAQSLPDQPAQAATGQAAPVQAETGQTSPAPAEAVQEKSVPEKVVALQPPAPLPTPTPPTVSAPSTPILFHSSLQNILEDDPSASAPFHLTSPSGSGLALSSSFPLIATSSGSANASYYSVLDIGSSTARAAVVRVKANNSQVELLGVGHFQQAPGSLFAGTLRDVDGIVAACNAALMKAERMAGKLTAPDTLVSLGSELMRGLSMTVCVTRELQDEPVSPDEFESLVDQSVLELKRRILSDQSPLTDEATEQPLLEQDLDVIDMQLSSFEVDDQPVASPLSLVGQRLSFRLFITCLPHQQHLVLREVMERLDLDLARVVTHPAALAHYMQGSDEFVSDALLLDVGAQTTRIAEIKAGQLVQVATVPFGGDDITQTLAVGLRIDAREAESVKLNYARGVLKGERRGRVQALARPIFQHWLAQLAHQLAGFAEPEELPSTFYMVGRGLAFAELLPAFRHFSWQDFVPSLSSPQLYPLRLERHPWLRDERRLLRDAGMIGLLATATTIVEPPTLPGAGLLEQLRARYAVTSP